MYIIIAILMFGLLVAIHELGHFSAAKWLGVRVNEFSIGMGPAILKKQRGETLYSLRCLPIGGYCALEGEDEETNDPRCFSRQPAWKKLIILAAGSFMNFLLGLVIMLILYAGSTEFLTTELTSFMEGCPYEGALQTGDEFYSIDGHRTYFTNNVTTYLNRGGETHDVVVIRDGQKVKLENLRLVPIKYPGQTELKFGFYFGGRTQGPLLFIKYAWYECVDFVRQVWMALSDLVAGAVGLNELTGPVGIVDMINDVGSETQKEAGVAAALENIAFMSAFIAVNLAVMNLLPLPALDGGRIFFLVLNVIINALFKRRIPAKYEGYVHAAGMILLLGLMAVVMWNDIVRIIA